MKSIILLFFGLCLTTLSLAQNNMALMLLEDCKTEFDISLSEVQIAMEKMSQITPEDKPFNDILHLLKNTNIHLDNSHDKADQLEDRVDNSYCSRIERLANDLEGNLDNAEDNIQKPILVLTLKDPTEKDLNKARKQVSSAFKDMLKAQSDFAKMGKAIELCR